jgi:hypothetical protein
MHVSHEALTLHSPRRSPWLTLLARCECLKRHGVGEREDELGADFNSIVVPSPKTPSTPGATFIALRDAVISLSTGPLLLPHLFVSEGYRGIAIFAHDGVSYHAFACVVAIIYPFAGSSRDRQQIADRPRQDECERSFCVGWPR